MDPELETSQMLEERPRIFVGSDETTGATPPQMKGGSVGIPSQRDSDGAIQSDQESPKHYNSCSAARSDVRTPFGNEHANEGRRSCLKDGLKTVVLYARADL